MHRTAPHLLLFCSLLHLPCASGATEASRERAHLDYLLHCQGCHLPDGSGVPNKVPQLRDQVGNFLRVKGGREFLVQVPGVSNATLDDARLAALLNWLLAEFGGDSLPADTTPYSADEIAALRQKPLSKVYAVRAALIEQMQNPPSH